MKVVLISEYGVLFAVLGLTLAAALCGFGLGWRGGMVAERRRAHREAVREKFDPSRRAIR